MSERFDDMVFLAVLVTAIILIFATGTNPVAVKVLTDVITAYLAVRITRQVAGPAKPAQ